MKKLDNSVYLATKNMGEYELLTGSGLKTNSQTTHCMAVADPRMGRRSWLFNHCFRPSDTANMATATLLGRHAGQLSSAAVTDHRF